MALGPLTADTTTKFAFWRATPTNLSTAGLSSTIRMVSRVVILVSQRPCWWPTPASTEFRPRQTGPRRQALWPVAGRRLEETPHPARLPRESCGSVQTEHKNGWYNDPNVDIR